MLWAEAESPGLPALFITRLNSHTSSVTKCPSVVWPWIWRKQRWWRQLSTAPVEVRGKSFYSVWGNTFSFYSYLCFIYPYSECVCVCVYVGRGGRSQVCHGEHMQLRRQLFGVRSFLPPLRESQVLSSGDTCCFASAFTCQAWKFIVGS